MENNETTVNLNGLGHRTLKTHREWKIMRQEAFSMNLGTEHERHIIEDHESGFDHHGVGHKTLKKHEISWDSHENLRAWNIMRTFNMFMYTMNRAQQISVHQVARRRLCWIGYILIKPINSIHRKSIPWNPQDILLLPLFIFISRRSIDPQCTHCRHFYSWLFPVASFISFQVNFKLCS